MLEEQHASDDPDDIEEGGSDASEDERMDDPDYRAEMEEILQVDECSGFNEDQPIDNAAQSIEGGNDEYTEVVAFNHVAAAAPAAQPIGEFISYRNRPDSDFTVEARIDISPSTYSHGHKTVEYLYHGGYKYNFQRHCAVARHWVCKENSVPGVPCRVKIHTRYINGRHMTTPKPNRPHNHPPNAVNVRPPRQSMIGSHVFEE